MRWASLVEDYGKELREGSADSPATDVFTNTEEGEKRWKDLKNRVVEHVSAARVQLSPVCVWSCMLIWRSNFFCPVNSRYIHMLMTLSLCPQNIRIMAKYYTRITMKRMAGLLDLSIDVSILILISHFKNCRVKLTVKAK